MRTSPPTTDCPKAKKTWLGKPGKHDWTYSTSWDGNHKKVLPFNSGTYGIARSGWRCDCCGEFAWKESDDAFAFSLASNWNIHVKSAFHQMMGRDRYGRKLESYNYSHSLVLPFVLTVTSESITIRCGKTIVARWSSGDMVRDWEDYECWLRLTGCEIVDAADMVGTKAA